jgi:glutamate N-acetyltransferase/amino-acid N-acetyltransferase
MQPAHALPAGFRFAAVKTNVKASGDLDLALIVADDPCVAAGVYTQNLVHAASIDWNRQITPTCNLRAVVINSGNANACTGQRGIDDNRVIAETVARLIAAKADDVLVLSTGIIGHNLPMNKITAGLEIAERMIGNDGDSWNAVSRAILTTDQGAKTACRSLEIAGGTATIHGIAKGAGMIGPNMATLLCVILTDVRLEPAAAQNALTTAIAASFNRISVEGHTSTNDSVILLGSGKSGVSVESPSALGLFQSELTSLCIELAKLIPADGEGAKHLIEIEVVGAHSNIEADRIARTVANSNLVKTAISGNDPNWGRIVSAVGYCEGIQLDATKIVLTINGFELFADGQPLKFDAAEVSQSMASNRETYISLSVGDGPGRAEHWTSDLTEAYVRFNSHYTT